MKSRALSYALWILVMAALAVIVLVLCCGPRESVRDERPRAAESGTPPKPARIAACDAPVASDRAAPPRDEDFSAADESEASMTEEEKREAEEDQRVDDFDNLTDAWMEPVTNGVTMAEVDAFAKRFASVPNARREECLQRALNLIPDENVMLLVGILMDKSQDKELIELIFNDILNRDEEVKQPILQQVYKDKTHPCWEDAAWLLE